MRLSPIMRSNFVGGFFLIFSALLPVKAAEAAEKSTSIENKTLFLGVEIKPFTADYIVRADVNVRARPTQKSKKVGRIDEGERIRGVGRANDQWIAYRSEGKDMGFVYSPVLYPVIDSSLSRVLRGQLTQPNSPVCDYAITFVGKSEAEGQVFQVGDYEVDWFCRQGQKQAEFMTPMFLTEGPYINRKPTVHQITIDILGLAINLEEVLSTNFFFDHEKRSLTFDGLTSKRLGNPVDLPEAEVESIEEALKIAVEIAHQAWDEKLWAELMGRSP